LEEGSNCHRLRGCCHASRYDEAAIILVNLPRNAGKGSWLDAVHVYPKENGKRGDMVGQNQLNRKSLCIPSNSTVNTTWISLSQFTAVMLVLDYMPQKLA
jgi:hypothetical protein